MLLRPRSTSLITTPDGRIAERRTYWPFGANRSEQIVGAPRTDLLYTGQREEKDDAAELGLYNYKARFYSTALGRFLSVDPLVGSGGDPQSWNPYTYVRNNPIRLVDPTGQFLEEPGDAAPPVWPDPPPPPPNHWVVGAAQPSAQEWVSAPAMAPYEPCISCIAWTAAAAAYQRAAELQAWTSATPQPATVHEYEVGYGDCSPSSCEALMMGEVQIGAGQRGAAGPAAGAFVAFAVCTELCDDAGRLLGKLSNTFWSNDEDESSPEVRPDVQLPGGGRSGQKVKDLKGPPNSVVAGQAPGRIYVTNEKGEVVRDVAKDRAKPVTPGVGFGDKEEPTEEELEWIGEVWGPR